MTPSICKLLYDKNIEALDIATFLITVTCFVFFFIAVRSLISRYHSISHQIDDQQAQLDKVKQQSRLAMRRLEILKPFKAE